MKLKDIKGQIGTKFTLVSNELATTTYMTLCLCSGMIPRGEGLSPIGGRETTAVVAVSRTSKSSRHPGHTFYFSDEYDIELVP